MFRNRTVRIGLVYIGIALTSLIFVGITTYRATVSDVVQSEDPCRGIDRTQDYDCDGIADDKDRFVVGPAENLEEEIWAARKRLEDAEKRVNEQEQMIQRLENAPHLHTSGYGFDDDSASNAWRTEGYVHTLHVRDNGEWGTLDEYCAKNAKWWKPTPLPCLKK